MAPKLTVRSKRQFLVVKGEPKSTNQSQTNTYVPVVPKNLLLGWDESGGTFPGEVGGVAMPQTADGLQSVPWEVSEARK